MRQDRHKKIKKKYTQAVKDGATVIIRSSDKSDLQTRDFQIINLGVTKFLEERMMKGIEEERKRKMKMPHQVFGDVIFQTTMQNF